MAKHLAQVSHPHLASRSSKGPPKVEDQYSREGPVTRFNTFLALKVTAGVGTMWCAYAFAALALVSLPSALDSPDVPPAGPPEHHHRRTERTERRN